jgi:hypothetical protein
MWIEIRSLIQLYLPHSPDAGYWMLDASPFPSGNPRDAALQI